MLDLEVLAEEIATIVDERVSAAVTPLKAENEALRASIATLEARAEGLARQTVTTLVGKAIEASISEQLPAVREETRVIVTEAVAEAVAAIPVPKDGSDADPELIARQVADAVAALPPARDGVDADPDVIRQMVAEAVSALPTARDGESIDPEQVRAWIAEEVGALPPAAAGASVTVDDVAPLIRQLVGEEVARIPAAQDGVGLAGALIDRTGALIVTLTNGKTVELGRVEGEPGKDGLGFDDLQVGYDGERSVTLTFAKGEQTKSFSFALPVVIDRGVFKDGGAYQTGDAVSFGGSLWIAQRDTTARPDGPDTGWRLAVKKGRDASRP